MTSLITGTQRRSWWGGEGCYPELNSEEEQSEMPLSQGSREIRQAFPDAAERSGLETYILESLL